MSYTNSRRAFLKVVLGFYKKHGRHNLPWRKTRDPYKILVSEVMLQQTQVDRVIPKYKSFLKKFPTARRLANAPLSLVLKEWQGLGYNRRAKMLHEAGKITAKRGDFPRTYAGLIALPGVGPYTAKAVRVFAFNEPELMIETNIRAAYLHHFFANRKKVRDNEILGTISLPAGVQPRIWYAALMDYGAHLKKTLPNPSRRSAHHAKQKPFKGSDREIRGAILKLLSEINCAAKSFSVLPFSPKRIRAQLLALQKDGLVRKQGGVYLLGG